MDTRVVLTRPAGTAASFAARVRALGGEPVLLPGLSLRGVADAPSITAALTNALRSDVLIFTSPAAVRYAGRLLSLRTGSVVCAVGQATARALLRAGVADVEVPLRQDSEGVLALSALHDLGERTVALIGAAGGRGLLRAQLSRDAARFVEVHVYRRGPARLRRGHRAAVMALRENDLVLLSSGEGIVNLREALAGAAWDRLTSCIAVVSSARLRDEATAAGFAKVHVAASAQAADLLAMAADVAGKYRVAKLFTGP
jgi:uroporphyrinogen-III synthase